MKLCAISDTHGTHPDFIKKCDILTISGDISSCFHGVSQEDYFKSVFVNFFKDKAKHVIFVAGNHDGFLERIMNLGLEDEFRKSLPENFHYLRDSSVIIDGIHFYGTPWTPEFCNWYFMKYDTEEGLGKIFSKIPEGVDYMLSHGPMWGCNDMIEKPIYQSQSDKGHLGSKMLAKYAKLAKVKNIFVGHIHSGSHKEEKILWDINDLNGYITSVNVSILDEEYKPFYKDVYTKKD